MHMDVSNISKILEFNTSNEVNGSNHSKQRPPSPAPFALHIEGQTSGIKSAVSPVTSQSSSLRAPYAQPVLDASKIQSSKRKSTSVDDRIATVRERRIKQQQAHDEQVNARIAKEEAARAKWEQSVEEKKKKSEEQKEREALHRKEVEDRKNKQLIEEKKRVEAIVARKDEQSNVILRQKRAASADRSKRWSWGAGGMAGGGGGILISSHVESSPSPFHYYDPTRITKRLPNERHRRRPLSMDISQYVPLPNGDESNIASSSVGGSIIMGQGKHSVVDDKFSKSPLLVGTAHIKFASGLRSYDTNPTSFKPSSSPAPARHRRARSTDISSKSHPIPSKESNEKIETKSSTRGRSPDLRKRHSLKGTSTSTQQLADSVSASSRVLAPTRASIARSINRNDLDQVSNSTSASPASVPMRSRSSDRKGPSSTRSDSSSASSTISSPRLNQNKSSKPQSTRGTSPSGRPKPRPPSPIVTGKPFTAVNHSESPKLRSPASNEPNKSIKRAPSPSKTFARNSPSLNSKTPLRDSSQTSKVSPPIIKQSLTPTSTAGRNKNSSSSTTPTSTSLSKKIYKKFMQKDKATKKAKDEKPDQDDNINDSKIVEKKPMQLSSQQQTTPDKAALEPDKIDHISPPTKQSLTNEDNIKEMVTENRNDDVTISTTAQREVYELEDLQDHNHPPASIQMSPCPGNSLADEIRNASHDDNELLLDIETSTHVADVSTHDTVSSSISQRDVDNKYLVSQLTSNVIDAAEKELQNELDQINATQEILLPIQGENLLLLTEETDNKVIEASDEVKTFESSPTDTPHNNQLRLLESEKEKQEETLSATEKAQHTLEENKKKEKKLSPEEQAYKDAISAKRREMKEKREREEKERQERLKIEAEEQARREEDARRMAEEARLEHERLLEEERIKKEESERKKKKEADELARKHEEFLKEQRERLEQKAREEAEKVRRDRDLADQKKQEERLARKKRLEMIMRRTRGGDSPTGNASSNVPRSGEQSPIGETSAGGNSPRNSLTPDRMNSPVNVEKRDINEPKEINLQTVSSDTRKQVNNNFEVPLETITLDNLSSIKPININGGDYRAAPLQAFEEPLHVLNDNNSYDSNSAINLDLNGGSVTNVMTDSLEKATSVNNSEQVPTGNLLDL